MEHIKTTPPKLGIPSFDIEMANRLCEEAGNPGIKQSAMFKLAKRVAKDCFGQPFHIQVKALEDRAIKLLQASKAETEEIKKKTQGHVFSMLEYEPAEKPDYHPHDHTPDDAA